jgi:hypothetical protein
LKDSQRGNEAIELRIASKGAHNLIGQEERGNEGY